MIRTVIFDIGNVLMNWDYKQYVRRMFRDEETVEHVNQAIVGTGYWNEMDRGQNAEEMLSKMIASDPDYEDAIVKAFRNVEQCMSKRDYAIPWIRELKSRGYRVLFLSNYSAYIMYKKPEVLDFIPYMDGGVFSCLVHLVKPDEAIYRRICNEYSLKPQECVFLDDTEPNILAADACGLRTIHFKNYQQARDDLEAILAESPDQAL